MMMMAGRALAFAASFLLSVGQAAAQTKEERYAELLMIQELINDPDPLMRLLNFEEIIADADRLKTELAIRTAMGVEDRQLRSAAMIAYLNIVELVTFDWELPEEIAEAAGSGQIDLPLRYVYEDYVGAGGKMPVLFDDIADDGSFIVHAMMRLRDRDERFSGQGRVLGERLVFRTPIYATVSGRPICNFEIIPTAELELRGAVSCEDYSWGGPMALSAAMF